MMTVRKILLLRTGWFWKCPRSKIMFVDEQVIDIPDLDEVEDVATDDITTQGGWIEAPPLLPQIPPPFLHLHQRNQTPTAHYFILLAKLHWPLRIWQSA